MNFNGRLTYRYMNLFIDIMHTCMRFQSCEYDNGKVQVMHKHHFFHAYINILSMFGDI